MKRFLCFFLSIFFIYGVQLPAFATLLPGEVTPEIPSSGGDGGLSLGGITVDIGDWLQTWYDEMHNMQHRNQNLLISLIDNDRCPRSSESNGRHNFIERHTQVDGQVGHYYICEYCGKSAGEVLDEAEAEYVATLPASTVTCDGGFYWYPTVDDVYSDNFYVNFPSSGHTSVEKSNNWSFYSSGLSFQKYNDNSFTYLFSGNKNYSFKLGFNALSFSCPCTGYYTCLQIPMFVGSYSSGSNINNEGIYYPYSKSLYFAGDKITATYSQSVSASIVDGILYFPAYKVNPTVAYNITTSDISETYNTGTRAASITGNYGIITESGDVQKIDSQTIVNEGNSTYYNPSTNETTTFTDWTYDYSDRSYTLTLESGDTTTITYGDEYVTINEGDTVTNVYYIVESSSGDDSGGGTDTPVHTHSYTRSVTREPTCTVPGIMTYTCTAGDDSYTEQIPATGHDWEVKQTVHTEYNQSADLIQQGYTIYRCTVCGEEYKVDDDSLPPGLVEDTDSQLAEIVQKVKSWFPQLSEMYQGYVGFLSATFPYLPEDTMILLNFGIASSVFIALLKALRR